MLDAKNEVHVTCTRGPAQAGVCIAGQLAGQRVVRHSGGAWFPAGRPTVNELRVAARTATFGGFFDRSGWIH